MLVLLDRSLIVGRATALGLVSALVAGLFLSYPKLGLLLSFLAVLLLVNTSYGPQDSDSSSFGTKNRGRPRSGIALEVEAFRSKLSFGSKGVIRLFCGLELLRWIAKVLRRVAGRHSSTVMTFLRVTMVEKLHRWARTYLKWAQRNNKDEL
jgi:hypothetical protein